MEILRVGSGKSSFNDMLFVQVEVVCPRQSEGCRGTAIITGFADKSEFFKSIDYDYPDSNQFSACSQCGVVCGLNQTGTAQVLQIARSKVRPSKKVKRTAKPKS